MTWDPSWVRLPPSVCRGPSCYHPYFNGQAQPEMTNTSRTCSMLKSESCIKYVVYDKFDKKRPVYVTRYCGNLKTPEGKIVHNSCHRADNVEVCTCRDKDKCNAGSSLKMSSFVFYLVVAFSFFLQRMFL